MRLVSVLALVLSACTDDPAPIVHVESATPDRLNMADDNANDITITIGYDDADGDLGGGIAEVHDCRGDSLDTMLAIPQLAAKQMVDDHAHITGKLDLYVNDIAAVASEAVPKTCTDLGISSLADMQTVFCIVLVDAAAHRGGGACTSPITLVQ